MHRLSFRISAVATIFALSAMPTFAQHLLSLPDEVVSQVESLSLKDITTGVPVSQETVREVAVHAAGGTPVKSVYDGYPAKKAGIKEGDRIIAVDGYLCWGPEEAAYVANCLAKSDRAVEVVGFQSGSGLGEWELRKWQMTPFNFKNQKFLFGYQNEDRFRKELKEELNQALKDAVRVNDQAPLWAALEVLPNRVLMELNDGIPDTGSPAPWTVACCQVIYDTLIQNWSAVKTARVETPSSFLNRYRTYCQLLAGRHLSAGAVPGKDFLGESQAFFVIYHPFPFSGAGLLSAGTPSIPKMPGFENVTGNVQADSLETINKQAIALVTVPKVRPQPVDLFMNQVAAACLCPAFHAGWPFRSNLAFSQPVLSSLRQKASGDDADSDMARLALLGPLSSQSNQRSEVIRHFKKLYEHSPALAFQGYLIILNASNNSGSQTFNAVTQACPEIVDAFKANMHGKNPLLQSLHKQFPNTFDQMLAAAPRQPFVFRADWMPALFLRDFPQILVQLK